jgi:hypothetical protein
MPTEQEVLQYITDRYGIPLTDQERRNLLLFRGAAYLLLLAYFTILVLNAIAITVCFIVAAAKGDNDRWQFLAAWAGGTTGLGAGSLLFKSVLDYLFGIGRTHLRGNVTARQR